MWLILCSWTFGFFAFIVSLILLVATRSIDNLSEISIENRDEVGISSIELGRWDW